jgi:glutaminase
MEPTPVYVSTGLLPPEERVRLLVREAFERFRDVSEGELSLVYPALAEASPDAFGISVVGSDGGVFDVGDADAEFTIMSVAKPFAFALVCAALGPQEVRERVGVNATGLPFNSLDALERARDGRTNPIPSRHSTYTRASARYP